MKKAAALILALLVLITLTACGSSKDTPKAKATPTLSASEAKVADSIADYVAKSSADQLTRSEASCFATAFVADAGLEDLTKAGLIDKDGKVKENEAKFDTKLAGQYADSFLACVDYAELAAKSFATGDKTIDEAKLASCLKKQLPDSLMRKVIVASQSGSGSGSADVTEANKRLTECSSAAKTAAK